MKKYILMLFMMAPMVSCQDFLDEKQVSNLTQDYYNTEGGLENLIKGLYTYSRIKHEWDALGARLIEAETDAYMHQDPNYARATTTAYSNNGNISGSLYNYIGSNPSNDFAPAGAYPHINNCNIALDLLENLKPGNFATDEALRNTRKGEALFLRAWAYYLVSNQLGDVPLVLEPKRFDNGIYYYPKSSLEAIYKRIISDMRFAYENLPLPTTGNRGRVNKLAAGHFLAKLYLNRAQAAGFQGGADHLRMLYKGSAPTDLDSVITITTEVINSSAGLAPDYWTLFNPQVSETSPHAEVLWSAQFETNTSLNGRYGNRSSNYHVGTYEVESHVHRTGNGNRAGLEYGRPFATFKPTDWGFDNFRQKVHDSRYDKTFRAEFIATTNAASPVKWTATTALWWNQNKPANEPAAVVGQNKASVGRRGLLFIENEKEDALDSATVVGQPFLLAARWLRSDKTGKYYYRLYPGGTIRSIGLDIGAGRNIYMGSKKFVDPNRSDYNSENGTRDAILMRLAETYLIRAEAYGRKGNYAAAVADINVLRKRAAYKPGEARPDYLVQWQPEAATLPAADLTPPYTVTEDPYSKIEVTENHFTPGTAEANAEKYIPSVGTKEEMFIHFIYNEMAREFLSEGISWEAQHNAGILYERVVHSNQMASDKAGLWPVADNPEGTAGQNGNGKGLYQPFHTFRPWPSQFLDLLTDENGSPLDAQAKGVYQNPGY